MPDCIEWSKCRNKQGYGTLRFKGKMVYAHRRLWEAMFGKIPDGLYVLHRCDNPPCVNIEHLFLGTKKDNSRDSIKKGRAKFPVTLKGEDAPWSKLTLEQVKEIRSLKGMVPQKELANRFGVNQSTISRIQINLRWSQ